LQGEEHHPNREARGDSIILWWCFSSRGTGALHKIDVIMKEENDVDILKQHLKINGQRPQAYFQSFGKIEGQQSQGIGVAITKP
jgi:hypothetical protein